MVEKEMTTEEHRLRHIELHKMLDELIADFIMCNPSDKRLTNTTLMELTEWSHKQTQEPDTPR